MDNFLLFQQECTSLTNQESITYALELERHQASKKQSEYFHDLVHL